MPHFNCNIQYVVVPEAFVFILLLFINKNPNFFLVSSCVYVIVYFSLNF